jgi:hypothetical protein
MSIFFAIVHKVNLASKLAVSLLSKGKLLPHCFSTLTFRTVVVNLFFYFTFY